jgi:adenylate cyclase
MVVDSQSVNFPKSGIPEEAALDADKLGCEMKECSILFSDIYGYKYLIKDFESSEVANLLDEYFQLMIDAVYEYKQNLQQQIELAGIRNSILAVFGSPTPLEDNAWVAVQTAMEMCDRLASFNDRRQADNKPAIKIGIGINSDIILSGQNGSSKRMEFTAIGEGVSIAYYLEGLSKQYGCNMILSKNTYEKCADRVWARELDIIRMRNNKTPVPIYEILGMRSDPLSDDQQKILELYNKGREFYLKRKFANAMGEFARLRQLDSHDQAAGLLLQRCQKLIKNPPADDWDGAWSITGEQ